MTAVITIDELVRIEHRIASPMVTFKENHFEDVPKLIEVANAYLVQDVTAGAVLLLHTAVENVRGGSVCSTCFTEDEEPEPYPCPTRRLLDGDPS